MGHVRYLVRMNLATVGHLSCPRGSMQVQVLANQGPIIQEDGFWPEIGLAEPNYVIF